MGSGAGPEQRRARFRQDLQQKEQEEAAAQAAKLERLQTLSSNIREESKYLEYIPFVAASVNGHTPLATRLLEAAIIGGVILFGTVQVLGERISHNTTTLQEVKTEVMKIRNDFYKPTIPE